MFIQNANTMKWSLFLMLHCRRDEKNIFSSQFKENDLWWEGKILRDVRQGVLIIRKKNLSFRIFVGFFLADYLYVRHFSSPSCPVFSLQCHLCSFWLLLFIGWANSVWSSFYFQLFLLPSPKNKLFAPLLTSRRSGKIDLPAKHLWYELRLFPLCLFLELLRRWW